MTLYRGREGDHPFIFTIFTKITKTRRLGGGERCLRAFVSGTLTRTTWQKVSLRFTGRIMLTPRGCNGLYSPRNVTLPLMPDTEMTEPPEPTLPAKLE
jgi:hypothetical protein